MEMELAKCKIDIMSLNSQLLDAIQQKLNLSQQLEAWQVSLTHTHTLTHRNASSSTDHVNLKENSRSENLMCVQHALIKRPGLLELSRNKNERGIKNQVCECKH